MKTLKLPSILLLIALLQLMAFKPDTAATTKLSDSNTFQYSKFDGYWAGVISDINDEDDQITCLMYIANGVARQLTYNNETEQLETISHTKESTITLQNNISFTWMNKSTVWSENQSFMMSFISDKALNLVWVRQVNNIQEDDDNEEWHVLRVGKLMKYSKKELEEIFQK